MRSISTTSIPEPAIILFIKLQHCRRGALTGLGAATAHYQAASAQPNPVAAGKFYMIMAKKCVKSDQAPLRSATDVADNRLSPINSQ
jgi:hypothetical protein